MIHKRTFLIAICLTAGLTWGGYQAWIMVRGSNLYTVPYKVRVMNAETRERFVIEIGRDATGWPQPCPGGEGACYPVEVCTSLQCRQLGGTWVILNDSIGKEGPTHCPVCGALVVPHNPNDPTEIAPDR